METNNGRCGPLCQHPGCWESDAKRPFRRKNPQYEKYVDQLVRQRSKPGRHKAPVSEGLPPLTVQTVALDGDDRNTESTSPENHTPPSATCVMGRVPRLHNVEVLLEAAKFSPSSTSLSVSPVLIWRPGRQAHKVPRTTGQPKVQGNVAVKNISDALPAVGPSSCSMDKVKFNSRPHSRASSRSESRPDSLDILHNVPHYLVEEILHQLRSEEAHSPAPSIPSPHPHLLTVVRPVSCHIPSSLICDLSTGQIYSNTLINASSSRDLQPPTPPPPACPPTPLPPPACPPTPLPPPANEPPSQNPTIKKRKRRNTLPPVSNKTSFSRALSQAPMTVLNRAQTLPPPPTNHSQCIHTTLLLPPHPPHRPQPHSSHRHRSRYPLGNPIVPRTTQTHTLDPLLAPYPSPPPSHPPHITNRFLHVFPADFHNARLVTLHCSSPLSHQNNHPAINEEPPPQIKDNQNKDEGDAVHLPPIPSPSPSLPCVSPDHMNLGAAIVGDQLVLDRGDEHVVHPLSDTVSRPETTPTSRGVVNGTQAPPPTAID